MKYFLLRMKVNGIKSIDKEVTLNFYKSNLTKEFDASNSHIKAIYGPNGAGKTGLIYAAEIYRNLVIDSKYLTLCNANGSLANLINQTNKELTITMVYACIEDNNMLKDVYSHTISVKEFDGEYKIIKDVLCRLSGLNTNIEDKYNVIYRVENGRIVDLYKNCKYSEQLITGTMNMLNTQSLLSATLAYATPHASNIDEELVNAIDSLICFIGYMRVVLQDTDTGYIDLLRVSKQLKEITKQQNRIGDSETFNNLLKRNKFPSVNSTRVLKTYYAKYEKYIANLTSFIKVFKDDLDHIEIKQDENGDFFECENILVYKDGKRINEKYESTGIKKVIELYSALCDVEQGKIVFIDEFDANIHDVLLVNLVEYIKDYSSGQLIFTTHNLGPMDVLQKSKNSIDFLSPDSKIASWSNSGNYSAASQYSKGLIEYSPFNIEPFSFLGVFGDD